MSARSGQSIECGNDLRVSAPVSFPPSGSNPRGFPGRKVCVGKSDSTRCLLDTVARPIYQDGARNNVKEMIPPVARIRAGRRASRAPTSGRTGRPHPYRRAQFPRPERGAVVARPLTAPLSLKREARSPGPRGRSPTRRKRRYSYERMPPLRETRTPALRQVDSTFRVRLPAASVRPHSYAATLRTRLLASGNGEAVWPNPTSARRAISRMDASAPCSVTTSRATASRWL